MSRIWFTSDTHFGHFNICRGTTKWNSGYRDFDNPDQMTDVLIDNLNALVAPHDILCHLGDFAMGPRHRLPEYRERINCQAIHLYLGNHDNTLDKTDPKYNPDHVKLFSSVQHYGELRLKGHDFILFHYPIGSWHKIGRSSIQLFGHCHQTYARTLPRQLDVGVDGNNYKPWLLEDIIEKFRDVPLELVDHHSSETSYH